jgi:hypothetical protein
MIILLELLVVKVRFLHKLPSPGLMIVAQDMSAHSITCIPLSPNTRTITISQTKHSMLRSAKYSDPV